MKKKILVSLIVLTLVFASMFIFCACKNLPFFGNSSDKAETSVSSNKNTSADHVHSWGEWKIIKEANCTDEGKKERVCSKCDEKETETIPAKGHQFNTDNKCVICGYTLEFTTGLDYEETNYKNSSGKSVTGYAVKGIGVSKDKNIIIPSVHAGKSVIAISSEAFSGNDYIESVYIPNGILKIGEKAFYYNINLKTLTIGNSIESIEKQAFNSCKALKKITFLSSSAVKITADAFSGTAYYNDKSNYKNNLLYLGNVCIAVRGGSDEIVLSDNTVGIAPGIFQNKTSLKKLTIPDNFTTIEEGMLSGCYSLEELTLPYIAKTIYASYYTGGRTYDECLGYLFGNKKFAEAIETLQRSYNENKNNYEDKTFYIPSSLKTVNVTKKLSDKCFLNCSGIEKITLSSEIRTIPSSAFNGCASLKELIIPESVTEIGIAAFKDCASLTSLIIPNSVTKIEMPILSGCSSLVSLSVPFVGGSKSDVGGNHKLRPLGIYFGTKEYNGGIYTKQFYDEYNNDTIYYIPLSLRKISITGEDKLNGTFFNCSNISEIDLGDKLVEIWGDGDGCLTFRGCNILSSINVSDNNANYCSIDGNLYSKDGTTLIQYSVGKTDKSFTLSDSVTSIGNYAFKGCSGLTSITIPDGVTSIGYSAFNGCSGLTSITFSGTIEQWNAISKGSDWNYNVPATVVHCSDGDVEI